MAFFLKREHGEHFEVKGLRFQIHRITQSSVTLRIEGDEPFRVQYKVVCEDIAEGDAEQAKKCAEHIKIGRLGQQKHGPSL